MASWYNTAWSHRWPIAIQIFGGAGVAANYDLQIEIPKEWDRFWDTVKSDLYDVILTGPDGTSLLDFKRLTTDYANRVLTLQVDAFASHNNDSANLIWLYFGNAAATDLASVFTAGTVKAGEIFLGGPVGSIISRATGGGGQDAPQIAITKTSTEEIDVFVSTAGLFSRRMDAYNNRSGLESIRYTQVYMLNASDADRPSLYDEIETRFIPSFVRCRIKAGADGDDITFVCKIISTSGNTFSVRALIQVRDRLPSA